MRGGLKEQFDQDGYVVLEDFLTPAEVEALRAEGDALARGVPPEERKSVFADQGRDEYFLNSGDKVAYFYEKGALGEDGALLVEPHLALNKVGHALHEKLPVFSDVTKSERVKEACRQLGLDTPAVAQSMYIYKNPGIGGEVVPHQDASYLYMDPPETLVGFWMPLEDATVENGCLWFIPGSHRAGVHTRFRRNPDKDAKELLIYDRPQPTYPRSSFVPVPVPKGSCVLIHGLAVHQSDRNKSDRSRHAYTFHVVDLVKGVYAEDNWLQPTEDAPFSVLYSKSWV